MNETFVKTIELLNDQEYHDGTSIGQELNITRAAVWKIIKKLKAYNISIQSTKGKGYFLREPLILLNSKRITEHLNTSSIFVEVLEKVGSTNDYVKKVSDPQKRATVCIAEMQTEGRGRLNRKWYSPFGCNVYLSLCYSFQKDISELSGLSLVISLAICRAIESLSSLMEPLFIKWPNDIVNKKQEKLSGTLIEIHAESNGFSNAIIGIGVNVNMKKVAKPRIDKPWVSLRELNNNKLQDRNLLCAELINFSLQYIERFKRFGLVDFMEEWKKRDFLFQRPLQLSLNDIIFSGLGSGINQQGHLIVTLSDGRKTVFSSGDTTLLK